MENIQAGLVIIGIVNGVRLYQLPDKRGFYYFMLAFALGVVGGLLHLFGLTLETGMVIALSSSGLYRVGEKVGGQ